MKKKVCPKCHSKLRGVRRIGMAAEAVFWKGVTKEPQHSTFTSGGSPTYSLAPSYANIYFIVLLFGMYF